MKYWTLIIIFVLFIKLTFSNDIEVSFRRVSPIDGLSSESVNKIVQDSYGFIWIGTNHGLLKYDSKSFERFSHDPEEKNSLPHSIVSELLVDHDNTLWIGTRNGLCTFDHSSQSFLLYSYNDEKGLVGISGNYLLKCDSKGNIWIIDHLGLGILNKKNHLLSRIKTTDNEIPESIFCANSGKIWMGTRNGCIYQVDPDSLITKRLVKGSGKTITNIYAESDKIWVGGPSSGLTQYNYDGKLIKKYDFNKATELQLDNWNVRKVHRDQSGNLWISTYQGLFMEQSNGKLIWFDTEKHSGIPHASIFDIYEDRQNGVWIGTWAGGLSYFHKANNQFYNYSHSKDPRSLSNNLVSSFAQNTKGELFVGTEKGGINLFDKKRGEFFKVPLSNKKNNYNIKSQCFDRYGGHWIASQENGLWHKAAGKKNFVNFRAGPEDGKHISYNEVYSIFPVDSGVWIGTHGGGVNFYDHRSKQISFYKSLFPYGPKLKHQYVKSILVDSHSNIWIGTVIGVQRIALTNKQKGNKPPSNSFLNGYTYSISELKNGDIWISTRSSGIKIYKHSSNSFTNFDANGLLKNKAVYGVIEDHKGGIWITSNDGLILHNPETNSSRKFVATDGIQGRWFNPKSVFRDNEDHLYFGGTNGFSTVFPDNIKLNTRPPEVLISKVTINNKLVKYPYFSNTDSLLNEIHLKPNETTLRFEFTSNNFLLPEKNRFKYRLINYYDEWIEADQDASALFANLKWGSYIFEVKSCNNDGIWCLEPARASIIISKPIYATNSAIIIYFLLISFSSYYLVRIYKTRAKLENDIFIEKVQRKNEEQLSEMKLKFFTNVSHEFRTPLTLISGPVRSLGKDENLTVTQKDMVDIIQRNSSRLLTLINQVIDFRKIEKGKEKLNLSTSDIIEFVEERVANFSFDAKAKSIQLIKTFPTEPILMEFDVEKVDYIIFNLLSNSFKHTSSEKKISISIFSGKQTLTDSYANQLSFGELSTDDVISIQITDEGSGIDADDLLKIFNRFEQGKTHIKNSSGIGLSMCREFTLLHKGLIHAHSTFGKGSCFIVQLPIKQSGDNVLLEATIPVQSNLPINKLSEELVKDAEKIEAMVLIVEDNVDLSNYITSILSPLFKVKTAENGQHGLEILKTTAVDIIVSDVMMPKMDGFEFCTQVKSDIATSHIPVILLTALTTTENKIRGIRQGADAYISKPFDDNLLLSQITNLLIQRKKLRDHFSSKNLSGHSVDLDGLDNYFLTKLNGIIEENIGDENLNIERLTELVGISRSQLHRKLKNLTNYSTTEYVRIYRLEKAINLLKTGQYNIDEVAHVVGFNTHSYFSRCFKKHYNQSPKEYLNKQNSKQG